MNGIDRIEEIIKKRLNTNQEAGKWATYNGNNTVSVNGNVLPCVFAVDIHAYKDDSVYVILNQSKTQAVIVGK